MQYLEQLTSEIYKDDMLLLLNCVELLTNLVLVEHGLVCLQQYGLLDKLQELLTRSLEDSLGSFILPGLLKFFGNLGHSQPKKLFKELPKVVNIIFNLCDSNDFVLKSHAVRTLGFIGAMSDGKRYLVQEGTKMEKYLQCVGDLIKGGSNEVKVDGLATMFDLIQIMVSYLYYIFFIIYHCKYEVSQILHSYYYKLQIDTQGWSVIRG
ncbi:26S proteasome non-ATPase regulatory subunit 5-like [Centruroides sculpturatus]|uniref:26S proteasome non-ATPase regulatory subunit 5-like n=1 Tax=Centruroides sculpturatus TaxID=218467 RepID=UPI000C6E8B90|nr:26S proteasome non-ATPase regulatory subunit 5-like [Centruroides sculpturatus]